jgi:hypothetical protein
MLHRGNLREPILARSTGQVKPYRSHRQPGLQHVPVGQGKKQGGACAPPSHLRSRQNLLALNQSAPGLFPNYYLPGLIRQALMRLATRPTLAEIPSWPVNFSPHAIKTAYYDTPKRDRHYLVITCSGICQIWEILSSFFLRFGELSSDLRALPRRSCHPNRPGASFIPLSEDEVISKYQK